MYDIKIHGPTNKKTLAFKEKQITDSNQEHWMYPAVSHTINLTHHENLNRKN